MWVTEYLTDICIDLSRFHQVQDITQMDAAAFFAVAMRLPYYDGAVTRALRERQEAQEKSRVSTAAELRSGEFASYFQFEQR